MMPEDEPETDGESISCPECGSKETGYFCRNCGRLLQGEDKVLCPRCHGIVPAGDFCPRCGQGLKGMALNLQQLALAGADFWVSGTEAPPEAALRQELAAAEWEPEGATPLAPSQLPDWLQELPRAQAPAEVQARIYPTLRPLEEAPAPERHGRFLTVVILLMAVMLIGLVVAAVFLLAGGGM